MGIQPIKISVVTVVLNDATGLEKTIRSIREQVYQDLEVIVIDGGSKDGEEKDGVSTDGTLGVIHSHAKDIAYWVSEPDRGIYDAMNKGLKVSTGEWVLFLNAGDVFADDQALQKVFSTGSPDADVIYGDSIADYGDFRIYRKTGSPHELWKGMICSHQAMFIRRNRMPLPRRFAPRNDNDAGFRMEYEVVADHELALRLYQSGSSFEYKNITVAIVDTRGISNRKQVRSILERYRMVKKSGEITGFRSLYYLCLWVLAVFVECGYMILPKKMIYYFIRVIHKRALISTS